MQYIKINGNETGKTLHQICQANGLKISGKQAKARYISAIEAHNKMISFTCDQIDTVYTALKERRIHPDGKFDKQGRWFPSDDEDCGVSDHVRTPSKRWPYSYMAACRTLKHVKILAVQSPELFEKQLRKAVL